MSGFCCRHLRFDDRCQSLDILDVFLVEVSLHELDTEMPLNLKHQLKNVDGVDFQVATQKWLVVAQILRGQISDPQALQYNGFELLLDAGHILRFQHPEHTIKIDTNKRLSGRVLVISFK